MFTQRQISLYVEALNLSVAHKMPFERGVLQVAKQDLDISLRDCEQAIDIFLSVQSADDFMQTTLDRQAAELVQGAGYETDFDFTMNEGDELQEMEQFVDDSIPTAA